MLCGITYPRGIICMNRLYSDVLMAISLAMFTNLLADTGADPRSLDTPRHGYHAMEKKGIMELEVTA